MQEENRRPYVEGALGRWFPVTTASQASPFWQADRHRKAVWTPVHRRNHAVRLHQELEVHYPEQRERLGQGDERVVSEKIPVRQGRRRTDRPPQAGCGLRLTSPSPRSCGERVGGEGLAPRAQLAESPPHPKPSASTLTAKRGEVKSYSERVRTMAITLSASDIPARRCRRGCRRRRSGASCCWRPICWCSWPFVVYPVCYGLWLARHPASYVALYHDPIFARAAVNTLIFLVIGINFKMLVALFLSGFFEQQRPGSNGCRCCSSCPGRCRRSRPFSPCASCSIRNGAVVNTLIFKLTGEDGPEWLNDPTVA